MRGTDCQQSSMFSYVSAERRVPKDHPLRAIRVMTEAALGELGAQFDALYASSGRPSIPPEKLLRALLLQVLYTMRSERLLMEQLDDNFLFRWFVGLSIDDPVWDATTFSKNRERLLKGEIAQGLRWSSRPVAKGCSAMSTSRSTARSSRRGPGTRVSSARMVFNLRTMMIQAIRASTFTANGSATLPISPPPIRKPAWHVRQRVRRPSSATPGTCGWTIARAWPWELASTNPAGAPNPRPPLNWWKRLQAGEGDRGC